MSTYLITDTNGYEITSGGQDADVQRVAQAAADRRGAVVTVTPYTTDDEDGAVRQDLDGEYQIEPVDDADR